MKTGIFLLPGNDVQNNPVLKEKGMNTSLFFFLLFSVQVVFIFQGVDVGDGGSYASFYQQIFDNPESVQYSFMFWLSGVIGGIYVKLFPGLGIWGIRLAGVVVSTGTIILSYHLLKRYLTRLYLQLSLFILTLFANNNPKDLYYNNLSALIYLAAICLLFSGLRDKKPVHLFLSGMFVSLNVFNRVPNILGLGIMAGIIFYGYLYTTRLKNQIINCFVFLLGFFSCSVLVLAVMYKAGHLQYYLNALKIVFAMGKTAKQSDGIESSYGIGHLIQILFWHYKSSLIEASLFFLFVLVILPVLQQVKDKYPLLVLKAVLSEYVLLLILIFLVIRGYIDNITVLYFFTGISLLTGAIILVTNKNREISLLTFLGCFLAIVHPVGSSTGIHTVIIYSLWIVFPVAAEYLFNVQKTNLEFYAAGKTNGFNYRFPVSEKQLMSVKRWSAVMALFVCLYYSYFYPYFDKSNRLVMHYPVNNKNIRGIYTSKERATALNELLAESEKYVRPHDYVLAYDCIPLYHYLTETRPYLRNPWPWLYQPDIFKAELVKANTEIKTLPVVVFQVVRTMGPNGARWPYYKGEETTLNWNLNESRNKILEEFLTANQYKEVWTNSVFKIFIPGKQGVVSKNK